MATTPFSPPQVRYLEVVDAMVAQLVRLLWRAEARGDGRYSLLVTGDHSTPVEFGDHSHEPVPVAIARLRHVVRCLGGPEAVGRIPLGPIPHPTPEEAAAVLERAAAEAAEWQLRHLEELQQQQEREEQEGEAGAEGTGSVAPSSSSGTYQQQDQKHRQRQEWQEQQQQEQQLHAEQQRRLTFCDCVAAYSEIDAADGALGRFCGSELMPFIKQFCGVERVSLHVKDAA